MNAHRVIAVFGLFITLSVAVANEDIHSMPTRELHDLLSDIAESDDEPGLSFDLLRRAIGDSDRLETEKTLFGGEEEMVYLLSDDRELRLRVEESRVVFAGVLYRDDEWDLLWK